MSSEAGVTVLERIRRARPRLSGTQAAIAEEVLTDPAAVVSATTASLAQAADVSQASVVRFARTLGYSGLPGLRLALAQELTRRDLEHEQSQVARGRIDASDSLEDLASKIGFHEARSIEETVSRLDLQALDAVARAIASGRTTTVLGVGASGLVAADLCQKLQRLGLACQFHADTHVQLVHAALLARESVAVGLSFSGRTVEVHKGMALAAGAGALTVAVTGDPRSPVAQEAEHVLVTVAREDELRIGAMASRTAQLAVVDVLFARVAQLRLDDLDTALVTTRAAVGAHRLSR